MYTQFFFLTLPQNKFFLLHFFFCSMVIFLFRLIRNSLQTNTFKFFFSFSYTCWFLLLLSSKFFSILIAHFLWVDSFLVLVMCLKNSLNFSLSLIFFLNGTCAISNYQHFTWTILIPIFNYSLQVTLYFFHYYLVCMCLWKSRYYSNLPFKSECLFSYHIVIPQTNYKSKETWRFRFAQDFFIFIFTLYFFSFLYLHFFTNYIYMYKHTHCI